MRVDRRLLFALALSLMAHLVVVSSRGWHLPFLDSPETANTLEAHLTPKPAPKPPSIAPQPVIAPQPKKKAAPRQIASPASESSASTPVFAPPSAGETASASTPSPVVEAAPAAEASKAEIVWPRAGRIRFAVTRGEGERAMRLGDATHIWHHDGEKYRLEAVAETTGLVSVFKNVRIVQTSEGAIGADGLAPDLYTTERNGQRAEGARFDWAAGKVTLTRGDQPRSEATLAAGAQDILSQIYQMSLIGVAARVEMPIATGKRYGRYAYEAVGDETLATPFGELRAWHVRTPALPGEQATELWLAQDYGNLPLRIRFTERGGEVYEQNAIEVNIDGASLAIQNK